MIIWPKRGVFLLAGWMILAATDASAFNPRPDYVKVVVFRDAWNASAARQLIEDSDAEVIEENYANATLAYVPRHALETIQQNAQERNFEIHIREDYDFVHLPDGVIDARLGTSASLPGMSLSPQPPSGQQGVYIVQFAGPILPRWLTEISEMGMQTVQYLRYNSFIVAATPEVASEVGLLSSVQFVDVLHAALKPQAVSREEGTATEIYIQLANVSGLDSAIDELQGWSPSAVSTRTFGAHEIQVQGMFDGSEIALILSHPLVFGVSNVPTIELSDERIAMSVSSNIENGAPTNPTQYKSWLAEACVYCSNLVADGFFAGTADTGLDGGNGGVHHADLPEGPRIRYGHNFIAGQETDTVLADTIGHGTMVAGIMGGDPLPARLLMPAVFGWERAWRQAQGSSSPRSAPAPPARPPSSLLLPTQG